ncbi:hypothetical protein DLAC_04795 [Tieghemostelium lacteum]|uniref:Uncharacterized protein n=1 Tax=Tieghemostelium lacteum TaxID=361077 RepID=A0A151ZKN2_TIELA|nr:hypothetical protein DLAC_04795 [Tieghemostelium lacteum]|eukprot:KYQ94489.1 hypothetical protein DLAC_04795 [Tieghemostelium lacteum]
MSFSQANSRELFEKCKINDSKSCLILLEQVKEKRIDVNAKYDEGISCLFLSAYYGNIEVFKALIGAGANINIEEKSGITPFLVSCDQGKVAIVEYIISSTLMNLIERSTILNGFIAACKNGHPQIIRRLIEKGLDVNTLLDEQGATALYIACENQREDLIILLLHLGADPNLPRAKYYPIHLAAQFGDLNTIERLLKAKAKINVQTPDGATSLLIAAQIGNVLAVDLLLKYNADPNIQMATDGSFPVYVSCSRHHNNSSMALLECAKTNVNLSLNDGTTILHILSQFGNIKLINIIFEYHPDVNVNATAKTGATPLHYAARHGQYEICNLLIQNGANINMLCDGDTPLSVASRYGRTDTINVLKLAHERLENHNLKKEDS